MSGAHFLSRFYPLSLSTRERSLTCVPLPVKVLLIVALLTQIGWHALRPAPSSKARDLPAVASLESLRIASFGDPWVSAKLLVIWLQAVDNQPGISIRFRDLDYDRVEGWLTRSLELDPRSQYPLLAASHLYGAVSDAPKQRKMFDFVYRQFLIDPNRRWRWLATSAITAKHRLKDVHLALKYARAITEHATGDSVPNWAKHMSVAILHDMGEIEAAALLIYRLLESGVVTDPHEAWFLRQKLEEMGALQ